MSNQFGITAEHLKQLIERIERLEADKAVIAEDIREVFQEAKGQGFDTKAMRQIIKLRKMDPDEVQEQDHILDTYKVALGMMPELEEKAPAAFVEKELA